MKAKSCRHVSCPAAGAIFCAPLSKLPARADCLTPRALLGTALLPEVPWRSGDAADCKSVHPGSIPGGTSRQPPQFLKRLAPDRAALAPGLSPVRKPGFSGSFHSVNPELTIWGEFVIVFFGDTHHHPTPSAGAHAPALFSCGGRDSGPFQKLCRRRSLALEQGVRSAIPPSPAIP